MAAEFLRSHGVDLDGEMRKIQPGSSEGSGCARTASSDNARAVTNASLPESPHGSRWTIQLDAVSGRISDIKTCDKAPHPTSGDDGIDARGALLAPSLCHPHIHLDKAYLLSHPKYSHLRIERGDFAEAMTITGQAKAMFEHDDLLERGQRVIDESIAAGVTHMRAFVELDVGVGTKCLDAGLDLKRKAESSCLVQVCAFAQLPLFSSSPNDEDGNVIRDLMESAAYKEGVDVLGSTPYVESDRRKMEQNVAWLFDLAIEHNKHIDFHLDYNLDPAIEPLVWHVVATAKNKDWTIRNANRTIVLGHCTRLTLLSDSQ
ncbi:hypothetical protein LTR53_002726 [Teratosphaeriaceae sp. CCFEE 6253]|nr:hypothetical protein LTR53_002726 [Teratosphaeriaceae sp. CCFEE 6253]